MERQTDHMVEDREEGNLHNSYYFELELYQMIKNGNVDDLKKFLSATRPPLKEGRMAGSPLRHAKNIFISTTVKAGMMGAITGAAWILRRPTSSWIIMFRNVNRSGPSKRSTSFST